MSPRDIDSSGKLTRFSLDRRITVLVMFLTTLVVGAVAAIGIPLEMIPSGFEDPFLMVMVPYRETPSPEIEQKLTIPMEEELSSLKGLKRISSFSSTNSSRIWLQFKQGTDMDIAYREVRDRVERARAIFPDDVDKVFYRKHDETGFPVAMLGVAIDPEITDRYNLIQQELVMRLQRIDGVASVNAEGLEEKEILIELDRAKLESSGLNIYALAQELGGDNFTMASGNVRHGSRKLLLRSVARYDNVEALENRMVGRNVRLKDIATVTYAEPEKRYRVRVNSRPAFALQVFKEGQANTMEVSRKVAAMVEEAQANPRLQSSWVVTLFNQGDIIADSLGTLVDSGKVGGLLALAVLFIFLRRFRMTAIIAMSIPLSIVIGLTVMYFAGESLNIITLLGLMICVGLLVDNSVVVAENIHRMHREGLPRRDACIRGAGEIALAIVMATLTTIVVFLPVSLVEGQGQFFLMRLAIPIAVSLSASLIVALIFIPLAVYVTLPSAAEKAARATRQPGLLRRLHDRLDNILRRFYELTFGKLNHGYSHVLEFFLKRRLDLVVALIVIFGATIAVAFQSVELTGGQEDERGNFEISIEMPRNTTLEESEAWFHSVEEILETKKEELDLEGYFIFHGATQGEINGWFNSPRTNELKPREVTKTVTDLLPIRPGMKVYTGQESETSEEKSMAVHTLTLQGDDYQQLEEVASTFERYLATMPGVLGIKKSEDQPPQEVALVMDRERAQRQGVNPAVVAGVVGYALRGSQLPEYRDQGKEIPVRVRFQEEDRQDLTELSSFMVPTDHGQAVPLSSVTDSQIVPTYRGIYRRNQRITFNLTLEIEEGKEKETRALLSFVAANTDFPEGISLGADERSNADKDDQIAMLMAALFSIIFIYLLMGYLFESFILPLSIILTIPLAAIGVGWAHFFMGLDIDFLGLVGAILLIGVVVNNGIVLIDYVNRLRDEGMERKAAIMQAADRRFRPIMMTALTTIFGMFPLIMGGRSQIGISYTSFGMTLIGGMTTATLMTLLVVPVFYTMFDDARQSFAWSLGRALGKRRQATAAAVTTTSMPGPMGTRAP